VLGGIVSLEGHHASTVNAFFGLFTGRMGRPMVFDIKSTIPDFHGYASLAPRRVAA
jgi:hypothetical protein